LGTFEAHLYGNVGLGSRPAREDDARKRKTAARSQTLANTA
jgi:hypothetical protein